MTISCHSSAAAARSLGAVRSAQRLAPLHVVVDVVASSLGAVAVARRSRRRCLRRRAGAPGAGFIVWPRSRRRDARSPLFYSGGSLHFGAVRSARRLALAACGRWRGRFLSGGGRRRAALTAPLPAAPRWSSWRRRNRIAALAAAWRSAAGLVRRRLALSARCKVLDGSRSLRVVVGAVGSSLGAVAVAWHSRRRCLRRRVGATGAGLVVPPQSRRRGARPPLFRGSGSLSRRVGRAQRLLSLRAVVGAVASSLDVVAVARRSRRRCLQRRAGARGAGSGVPPRSRRREARLPLIRGGGSRSRRDAPCSAARPLCVRSLARSLPLWGRSPSRGAHGAAACGA